MKTQNISIQQNQNIPSSRTILCMKWGKKYGSDYVNRLYSMVQRNLEGDFRMVCLTDSFVGIRKEVDCFPIPDLKLDFNGPERGWKKLSVFSEKLYDIRGVTLFLDLDVVIKGDLGPFFDFPGEFLIIHDWMRPWRVTGNSSVFRFDCGTLPEVLSHFQLHTEKIKEQFRNEQAYLSAKVHALGKLKYWPSSWCVSWKYHCIPSFPFNFWQIPKAPLSAKVLVFHGVVNPPDAILGRRNGNWRFAKAAPWIGEYWRE